MLNSASSKDILIRGNDAIDSLNKISALVEAVQFLSSTDEERELRSELLDVIQNVIRRTLGDSV
ncbi:hypothetical protein [Pantoea sp. AS-PWVM4]|uniref:hypothetical protein n=1 Tax=Pantoea sp. AS-PWVM4 TaxID=1332069 RepID=UPI00056ADCB8|nr:hypothetical protein [Pantoea sp. AS-PWVM4]